MDFNYVFFSGHFTCGCTLYKKMRHFCDIGLHPLLDYNDLTPQETWLVLVVQHLSFSQLPTWQSHMRDSRNSGRTWLLSREIPRTATLNETTRDFVLSAGANVHACLCSSLYKKAMAVISAPHMPWGLSWRSKCIKSDHSCIKKCVKSTNLEHQHLRATNTLRNWFDSINTVVRRRLHRKYKKIKTGSRFYMNEQ